MALAELEAERLNAIELVLRCRSLSEVVSWPTRRVINRKEASAFGTGASVDLQLFCYSAAIGDLDGRGNCWALHGRNAMKSWDLR
jgi:hypothetical protein